jgi:23S rRNA (adenine2503-C2)-methyltransferase
MNIDAFFKFLETQKPFRQRQLKKIVFVDLLEDWSLATVLPLDTRETLAKEIPLTIDASYEPAENGGGKALINLPDNLAIETVLINHNSGRLTVCVSCQVGCPMNCAFCATGKLGLKRSLTAGEIVEQFLFFCRQAKKEFGTTPTNIVFMGMGEPFLNYENVWQAVECFNDQLGFNIGARKISISTSGVITGIDRLSKEDKQVNLAISLHAPNDVLRSKLMPINQTQPLEKLIPAIDKYIKKTGRRVMFEYMMLKGINDSPKQALELAHLLRGKLCFVNLLLYNDTGVFQASDPETAKKFKQLLMDNGLQVIERYRFGRDIQGACGQLAGQKINNDLEDAY